MLGEAKVALELRSIPRRSERQGIVLLVATVLLLLVLPWAEPHRHGRVAVSALFLLTIATGIGGALDRGWGRVGWVVIPLAIVWVGTRLTGLAVPIGGMHLRLYPLSGLILVLLVLANILRALTAARRIGAGVLAEAFTGYLLVAIAFAQFYGALSDLLPDAFNTTPPAEAAAALYIYFSLVTLASLGYGDILPVHPFVRMVAALEGVCGLFYTAVVIARLVSAYRPRQVLPSAVSRPARMADRDNT
jgi:Ion channel